MKKVRFYCCEDYEDVELDDDVTEEEINDWYKEFIAGVNSGWYFVEERL